MNVLSLLAPAMDALKGRCWQAIFAAITVIWTVAELPNAMKVDLTIKLLVIGAVLQTVKDFAYAIRGVDHRGDAQRRASRAATAAAEAANKSEPAAPAPLKALTPVLVLLASMALLFGSSSCASARPDLVALAQAATAKGQKGFDGADELATNVTDPAKQATIKATNATNRVEFLNAMSTLVSGLQSGLTPADLQAWLAIAVQVREEALKTKAALESKPAK
jgi:hypothetical protein